MARPRRTEQLADPIAPVCDDFVVHLDAVRFARTAVPATNDLRRLTELFAALGDPTRLRIVAALTANELCVCDIAAVVGLSESAVSHHLRHLRELGLVRNRRDGRLVMYALDDDHVSTLFAQANEHIAHQEKATEV